MSRRSFLPEKEVCLECPGCGLSIRRHLTLLLDGQSLTITRPLDRYTVGMTPGASTMHQLREVLSRHPEVRLALLFGSRARGRAAARADLDLAIEGEGIDRLELGRELGAATGLDIDLVPIEHAGYPLLNAILRDGILVHEGAPHARARFLTRAILQTETDRPWFERMRDAYLDRLALRADG